MDSNIERLARIERISHDLFYPHHEIYDDKKKTKLIHIYERATQIPRTAALDDDNNDLQPSVSGQYNVSYMFKYYDANENLMCFVIGEIFLFSYFPHLYFVYFANIKPVVLIKYNLCT